jgi:hypothetical protein
LKWKNPTFESISFQEIITEIIPRKNVRMSITRLKPSRARCKLIPNSGIQLNLISISQSLSDGFDCKRYKMIRIKSVDNATKEIIRGQI